MDDNENKYKLAALEKLISEFSEVKYGDFVLEEIDKLERGDKHKIGFQSEADDVILDISLRGCSIRYVLWVKEIDEFVNGEGEFGYEFVKKEILKVPRGINQ